MVMHAPVSDSKSTAATTSPLRPYIAVAAIYVCSVGGLLGIAKLFEFGQPILTGFVLTRLLFLFTAVLAFVLLGQRSVGAVFGRGPSRTWLAIGPLVGLACYGINCLWVFVSSTLQGVQMPYVSGEISFWTVILAPLLVAYTEELVFRGVLWAALARITDSGNKILLQTSVLFALVHLVNRGGLYELPHRFVAGLLLGWLRLRSGSIIPSVHAHFIVLALATVDS